MSRYAVPPHLARLVERLRDLGVTVSDSPDAEEARDAIEEMMAAMAVCSRAVIDGKERCLRFFEYHQAVYGEKWVHREHRERGKEKKA